jgi:hypothetical protein
MAGAGDFGRRTLHNAAAFFVLLGQWMHACISPLGEWLSINALGAWEETVKVIDLGDRSRVSLTLSENPAGGSA